MFSQQVVDLDAAVDPVSHEKANCASVWAPAIMTLCGAVVTTLKKTGFVEVMNAGPAPSADALRRGTAPVWGNGPTASPPPPVELAQRDTESYAPAGHLPWWRTVPEAQRPPVLDRIAQSPEIWSGDRYNFDFRPHHYPTSALALTAGDSRVLLEWAAATGQLPDSQQSGRDEIPTLLRRLMMVRVDRRTAEGAATFRAWNKLGFLSDFGGRMLPYLDRQLQGEPAHNIHFHYNGHMTGEVLGMAMGLDWLGLRNMSMSLGAASGVAPVPRILASRITNSTAFKSSSYNTWRTQGSVLPSAQQWLLKRIRASLITGEIFILDKVRDLLTVKPLPNDICNALSRGKIRLIIHNRGDHDALKELPESIQRSLWAVDLSGSRLKKFEAKLIGRQYALLAAREARQRWQAHPKDLPIVIVGNGLLGGGVRSAFEELGISRRQLHIIDTDSSVQLDAEKKGHPARMPPPDSKALVFIAPHTAVGEAAA
jgi:hypothetical protein